MAWEIIPLPEAEAELQALPVDMQARFLRIADMLSEQER